MSIVLESRMLRDFLHRLVDGLVDDFEGNAKPVAGGVGVAPPAQPGTSRPRIMLAEKPERAPRAEPAPAPRQQCPDVTISCRSSCGRLEVAVSLAAGIAQRLGLKEHGKAAFGIHRGKLRVLRASKVGRAVYAGGTSGRLFFSVWGDDLGLTEKHVPEGCAFRYDTDGALLIEPPSWLKQAAAAPQKATADPPATCKKMTGTNPAVKCGVCTKAMATVECNLCPTLLCDACWEAHVRTHWHADGKATTYRGPAREHARA